MRLVSPVSNQTSERCASLPVWSVHELFVTQTISQNKMKIRLSVKSNNLPPGLALHDHPGLLGFLGLPVGNKRSLKVDSYT